MTYIAFQNGDQYIAKLAKEIRLDVFVNEQDISLVDELDDLDANSWHFVLFKDGKPISTARVFLEDKKTLHIGRVATLKDYRGNNFASEIFGVIDRFAKNNHFEKLILGAQLSAKTFYETIGFIQFGDVFLDANIEHIMMNKIII